MSNIKYTKELLEPIVKESISVAEVLRKMGKNQAGSIATHLSKVIKKLDIDTSHFLGSRANQGMKHVGGSKRKEWNEILVLRKSDRRESAYKLRRALIESGRPYECELCGNTGSWLDKALRLQVEHKNGNWQDCRPQNVGFYCPNCHSQTLNHSGSQGFTDLTSVARYSKELRRRRQDQDARQAT